jgi:hypothetical protein
MLPALAGMACILVSCLRDAPEEFPQELEWNPELAFPLVSDTFGMNAESGFDTTLLQLDTITGLPRWVAEQTLVFEGSIEFDLSAMVSRIEYLNRILFRLHILNGFPNEALAQAYFRDASGGMIDSMFSSGPVLVPPGKVKGNGETVTPSEIIRDATFGRDRIGPLQYATEIELRSTYVEPVVDTLLIPFYPLYHIDLEVGAMLDLTINF